MGVQVPFRKVTLDRLLLEVLDYQGHALLVLAKDTPSATGRPIQVLGIVLREINSPTYTWFYEYDPLPEALSRIELNRWLLAHSYLPGMFDQYGNFRQAA
jgi:hypothetical protein